MFTYGVFHGIILWGLAFISVHNKWKQIPNTLLVFITQKLYATYLYYKWIAQLENGLMKTFQIMFETKEFQTTLFFLGYGISDLLMALFFGYLYLKAKQNNKSKNL